MASAPTPRKPTYREMLKGLIDAEYQLRSAGSDIGIRGQIRWRLLLAADRCLRLIDAAISSLQDRQ